jgi:tetratricopeptide (TPR) repeat protein
MSSLTRVSAIAALVAVGALAPLHKTHAQTAYAPSPPRAVQPGVAASHAKQATQTSALETAQELIRLGQYQRARTIAAQALAVARQHAPRTSETADLINAMALATYHAGNHAEAEPLYREALEIRRETFGDRHPDVAQSLNNLAELLRATGRYDQAEPLYREALDITREALGPRHPDVAASLN